jgi:hypothetical protein
LSDHDQSAPQGAETAEHLVDDELASGPGIASSRTLQETVNRPPLLSSTAPTTFAAPGDAR